MVDLPNQLRCLFSATLERHGDSYVLEVPREELDRGDVRTDETYRVAVLSQPRSPLASGQAPDENRRRRDAPSDSQPTPPVEEGEVHGVAIESLGDRGDGIAKVERGYVLIVPGGRPGDEVTVEIENVRQNVAFADIIENESAATSASDLTDTAVSQSEMDEGPPPVESDESE